MALFLCFLTLLQASQGLRPYVLMDTTSLAIQGNYTIGYLNMSSHRRIGMFKFPAVNTGLAKTLTLNTLTETMTCNIKFTLYALSSSRQIGSNVVGAFKVTGDDISMDVSNARWQITKDVYYYLTIQTHTFNNDGAYCNMKLPCGQDNLMPPVYRIVTQQGPNPWTTLLTADGGYIHMKIEGQRIMTTTFAVSNSVSTTSSVSPSASPFVSLSTSGYTRFSPTVSPLTTRSIISSYNNPVNTAYFAPNVQISVDTVIDTSISDILVWILVWICTIAIIL